MDELRRKAMTKIIEAAVRNFCHYAKRPTIRIDRKGDGTILTVGMVHMERNFEKDPCTYRVIDMYTHDDGACEVEIEATIPLSLAAEQAEVKTEVANTPYAIASLPQDLIFPTTSCDLSKGMVIFVPCEKNLSPNIDEGVVHVLDGQKLVHHYVCTLVSSTVDEGISRWRTKDSLESICSGNSEPIAKEDLCTTEDYVAEALSRITSGKLNADDVNIACDYTPTKDLRKIISTAGSIDAVFDSTKLHQRLIDTLNDGMRINCAGSSGGSLKVSVTSLKIDIDDHMSHPLCLKAAVRVMI